VSSASDPPDRGTLDAQLAYYRRRIDELGGENVKLDISLSGLRHSLRQKQTAFALLTELQRSIGSHRDPAPLFELTVRAINTIGGMDKAIVLLPGDSDRVFRPAHAAGLHEQALHDPPWFRFPDEFTTADALLLVTKLTEPTPLAGELAEALDLPYFVCVPIVVEGATIGLLLAGRAKEAKPLYPALDEGDVDTFRALAGLIAVNVEHQRMVRRQEAAAAGRQRVEQELEVARLIQRNFLPKRVPELPGWRVAAHYRPAREVGGDFYDVIPLPDGRVAFVVGDVTDKGVPAALVMSATRSVLRATAQRLLEPGTVLREVNEYLVPDMPEKMFVTCLYAVLDPASGELCFANAGHDLPYLRTGGEVVELRARGMPLGLMAGMEYEERAAVLGGGDSVLLHSDGIVEAHDARREMFGFPRLQKTVAQAPRDGDLIAHVLAVLAAFTGADAEQEDDITMVTLERMGGEEAAVASGDDAVLAEFDLPSQAGNERDAIDRVTVAVADVGIEPARLERLKTAVGEATMNAMEHGSGYRPDRPVWIRVVRRPARLCVEVTDMGGALEVAAREAPDIEAKLAGAQSPRGWGLFLINEMVDEANVTSENGRRTLELVVRLDSERR
jgi:serine phosphatase RsbU (regulator of sigma subunit)/anti-sigma regulatory factor (Ser/Thr protein kinase)